MNGPSESTSALATYNQARSALATCARIDEVKRIRDKCEALRAYAIQVNDCDMAMWVAEIKVRAQRRLGELSAALEKARPGTSPNGKRGGTFELPRSGSSKVAVLKAAGLTPQAAHRCEQLASVPEAKFEKVIRQCKEAGKPVSAGKVLNTVAKPPSRPQSEPEDEDGEDEREEADTARVAYFIRADQAIQFALDCKVLIPKFAVDRDALKIARRAMESWSEVITLLGGSS